MLSLTSLASALYQSSRLPVRSTRSPVSLYLSNHAIAPFTASCILLSGLGMDMRTATSPALSAVQNDGSSNALAGAGAYVTWSCCWHHTVGFPLTRICVLSMQSMALLNDALTSALVSSSRISPSYGHVDVFISRNILSMFAILPSLYVMCT